MGWLKNHSSTAFDCRAHKAVSIRRSVFFSTDICLHCQKCQKYFSRESMELFEVWKNKLQHILSKTNTHSWLLQRYNLQIWAWRDNANTWSLLILAVSVRHLHLLVTRYPIKFCIKNFAYIRQHWVTFNLFSSNIFSRSVINITEKCTVSFVKASYNFANNNYHIIL